MSKSRKLYLVLGGSTLTLLIIWTLQPNFGLQRPDFIKRVNKEVRQPTTKFSPTSATNPMKPPATVMQQQNTEEPSSKIRILTEIFQSKNDNDPRLDTDFNQLTVDQKKELRTHYETLTLESRNERGTIVFLLGKNLDSGEDFDFFKQVLAEGPCTSLENCTAKPSKDTPQDETGASDVTLEYPKLVALKSLEGYLKKDIAPAHYRKAVKILETASNSSTGVVRNFATTIIAGLHN